jgi:hypothetical protein
MYDTSSVIITPYTRTLVDISSVCAEEPEVSFTHYDLFCLETWLAPLIKRLFGKEVGAVPITVETNDIMQVTVTIVKGDLDFPMDQEQVDLINKEVAKITSTKRGRCLLYDYSPLTTYSHKPIVSSWIKQMLPYVQVPQRYEPQIVDEGLAVGNLGLEYLETYNELFESVVSQLREMYDRGYILNASSIAQDWELEVVDQGKLLYRATWHDNRWIDDLYIFLEERLRGEKWIYLPIQPSYVYRHLIAERFPRAIFTEYKVGLEVNSLQEARKVVNSIQELSTQLSGEVTVSRSPIPDALSYLLDGVRIWSLM